MMNALSRIVALIAAFALIVILGLMGSRAHAQTSFAAAPPPRCMVDQFAGNLHTGKSAAGDTVGILWCDDQKSLAVWATAGSVSDSVDCIGRAGSAQWSLAWLQAAWATCIDKPMTADQAAEYQALLIQWLPRLHVAAGANRNVYTSNADGSRGPQLVIGGFGMQIAPGTLCGGNRLQGAGSRYNDVSNYLSTNGMLLPAGSFALCTISYPPATGWPAN